MSVTSATTTTTTRLNLHAGLPAADCLEWNIGTDGIVVSVPVTYIANHKTSTSITEDEFQEKLVAGAVDLIIFELILHLFLTYFELINIYF